jgi:hypothetical protein
LCRAEPARIRRKAKLGPLVLVGHTELGLEVALLALLVRGLERCVRVPRSFVGTRVGGSDLVPRRSMIP